MDLIETSIKAPGKPAYAPRIHFFGSLPFGRVAVFSIFNIAQEPMLFRVQKRPRLCNLACILTLCSCNQDIARFEKILYVFVSDFISFEEGVCTIILGTQYVRHVVQKKNELPTSCPRAAVDSFSLIWFIS